MALLAEAATFLDGVQQELVFFRGGRIAVPVDYDVSDLQTVKTDDIKALTGLFDEAVHLDQKMTILSEGVVDAVAGLPAGQRFRQVLREVKDIEDKVTAGYRLFASRFTYSASREQASPPGRQEI